MITAKTIMSENVITTSPNATLTQAAKIMVEKHLSTLMVTENSLPVASLGRKELVEASLKKNSRQIKVSAVMNTNFAIINPETPYQKVQQILANHDNKRCAVVENNKLVGIITESDIRSTARDFTRNERIKQDVTLVVFGLITAIFLFLYSPVGRQVLGLP